MTLKQRFLSAVVSGVLGVHDERGVIVTLAEFKNYFSDITSDYINSFLPAATFEPGQATVTHTKYLTRIRKGVYLVHMDAVTEQIRYEESVNKGLSDELID